MKDHLKIFFVFILVVVLYIVFYPPKYQVIKKGSTVKIHKISYKDKYIYLDPDTNFSFALEGKKVTLEEYGKDDLRENVDTDQFIEIIKKYKMTRISKNEIKSGDVYHFNYQSDLQIVDLTLKIENDINPWIFITLGEKNVVTISNDELYYIVHGDQLLEELIELIELTK